MSNIPLFRFQCDQRNVEELFYKQLYKLQTVKTTIMNYKDSTNQKQEK